MVIFGAMKVWRWAPDDGPIAVRVGELKGVGGSNDGPLWLEIREAATSTAGPSIGEAIDEMALADYEPGMLDSIQLHDIPVEQAWSVALQWRRGAAGNLGAVRRLVAYTLSTDAEQTVYSGRMSFLCGANWLITSIGLERQVWPSGPGGGGIVQESLLAYAKQNWHSSFGAGDLANLILRTVVGTWTPVLARVDQRLQSLTKAFLDGLHNSRAYDAINDRTYAAGLLEVQRIVHGMSPLLAPLARPTANMSDAWFRGKHTPDVAAAVQQLVEHSAQSLASQQEEIRASFALIAATQTSEQLTQTNEQLALAREAQRLAEAARRRSEEVQASIDFLGTVLVGPGLVAAFFAAVPGTIDGLSAGWQGLVVGASMAVGGTLSFFGLREYRSWRKNRALRDGNTPPTDDAPGDQTAG